MDRAPPSSPLFPYTTLFRSEGRVEPDPSPVRWGPRALMAEAMRSPSPVTLANDPREVPIVLGGTMAPYRWSIGGQFYPKEIGRASCRGRVERSGVGVACMET